jgi:hypothetical protein
VEVVKNIKSAADCLKEIFEITEGRPFMEKPKKLKRKRAKHQNTFIRELKQKNTRKKSLVAFQGQI